MRKYLYLSIILSALLLAASCKKDKTEDTKPTNNNNTTACNGKTLCFKLDGTEESHDAKWKVLTDRYRIYWEEGSGTTYKNIEMDVYATATGTYQVSANPSAGAAGFQYYFASGKNIEGQSGTVEITNISGDKITGKFTITAKDGSGTTYQVTEGNFVNVPK